MLCACAGWVVSLAGAVLAVASERCVAPSEQMEFVAGLLIIGGLSLIAIALAWVLGPSFSLV